MQYLTPQQVYKQYGFHPKTLADWADDGKIEFIRSPGGHRRVKSFTDVLEFIWGEETKITRQITYQVAGLTLQAEPIVKLAAIEALEAMGNVFFTASSRVTSELRSITKKEYAYFGESHLEVETGHTMGTSEVESCFTEIELTEEQQKQAFYVVEEIFKVFSEWTYELLRYAHNHPIEFVNSKNSDLVLTTCR